MPSSQIDLQTQNSQCQLLLKNVLPDKGHNITSPWFTVPLVKGIPQHLTLNELRKIIPPSKLIFSFPLSDILCTELNLRKVAIKPEDTPITLNRQFFGIPSNIPLLLTLRDTAIYPDVSVFGGENNLFLASTSGRIPYSLDAHIQVIQDIQPDFIVCPAEELPVNDATIGSKREQRSITKAKIFEENIIKRISKFSSKPFILANLQGGASKQSREQALIRNITATDNLPPTTNGYYVGGIGYKENLYERAEAIKASLSKVVSSLSVFTFSSIPGSPVEVLQAIWLGIDLVEIWYPILTADRGIALDFDVKMPTDYVSPNLSKYQSLLDYIEDLMTTSKILRFTRCKFLELTNQETYSEDFSPVSSFCNYSKAYVHQLFNCREMLGPVLLTMHNWRLYFELFNVIHQHLAVSNEALAKFIVWFLETQTIPHGKPLEEYVLPPPHTIFGDSEKC